MYLIHIVTKFITHTELKTVGNFELFFLQLFATGNIINLTLQSSLQGINERPLRLYFNLSKGLL